MLRVFHKLQSVTVEVRDSSSSTVSDTESLSKTKPVNPVVRVTSLKSLTVNRTGPSLHASVHALETECSSQCAVRFPKVNVGVTSGDCSLLFAASFALNTDFFTYLI